MNYQHRSFQPIEFELAVACCRWAYARGEREVVDRLVARSDWDLFLSVARRHRVQGLLWYCLNSLDVALPSPIAAALADDARQIAGHGLRAAQEMAELGRRFEQAGIPLLFVKGVTLGALAYGNPFVKMSWDIDILVPADAIAAASAALGNLGYHLVTPAVPSESDTLERWHRTHKESVWAKADRRMQIDLHSALADNPRLIPRIGIDSPRQLVEIAAGRTMPTLATDELFAYLCVHGASSAWFRLKWLTDLAALLHGKSPTEIERLYRRSQQLGAGRAAGQAMLLCAAVFGTPVARAMRREIASDPANRWLARTGLSEMTGRSATKEPTDAFLGTAWIHLSQLFLLPGLAFKTSEVKRQFSTILGRQ